MSLQTGQHTAGLNSHTSVLWKPSQICPCSGRQDQPITLPTSLRAEPKQPALRRRGLWTCWDLWAAISVSTAQGSFPAFLQGLTTLCEMEQMHTYMCTVHTHTPCTCSGPALSHSSCHDNAAITVPIHGDFPYMVTVPCASPTGKVPLSVWVTSTFLVETASVLQPLLSICDGPCWGRLCPLVLQPLADLVLSPQSAFESEISEIAISQSEVDLALRNLKAWMKDQKVPKNLVSGSWDRAGRWLWGVDASHCLHGSWPRPHS